MTETLSTTLDPRQMALLSAMSRWPINQANGVYQCVGSGRLVPIRFDARTLPRMAALGLCVQSHTIFRATEAGVAAWREQGDARPVREVSKQETIDA